MIMHKLARSVAARSAQERTRCRRAHSSDCRYCVSAAIAAFGAPSRNRIPPLMRSSSGRYQNFFVALASLESFIDRSVRFSSLTRPCVAGCKFDEESNATHGQRNARDSVVRS
jgi:hypothetical protein